ncbi:MAG: MarC family protein [Spirochaetaceae bacterium]|jgi:multiple antibiotic resistance protein|nr:MarC family protein [Spirochaetaceae bacterium]
MDHGFFQILFTVLIVMDPVGIIPYFLGLTSSYDKKTRDGIILKAVLFAALVLGIFLLCGKYILDFFGIKPGAFYISGGILFFVIAFEMIYSKPKVSRTTPEGNDDTQSGFIALFPLAIPMIAGPGILTVIMTYVSSGDSWISSVLLLLPALVIGLLCMFAVLRASTFILRVLGTMGIFVMEKIMGLILAGFSVQLIYNGLVALSIIK